MVQSAEQTHPAYVTCREFCVQPNACEFSCGFNFPYSTKLLHRAASYNSSLASSHSEADRTSALHLDPFVVGDLRASRRGCAVQAGQYKGVPAILHDEREKFV